MNEAFCWEGGALAPLLFIFYYSHPDPEIERGRARERNTPLCHGLSVQSGLGLMGYGDVRLVEPGVGSNGPLPPPLFRRR